MPIVEGCSSHLDSRAIDPCTVCDPDINIAGVCSRHPSVGVEWTTALFLIRRTCPACILSTSPFASYRMQCRFHGSTRVEGCGACFVGSEGTGPVPVPEIESCPSHPDHQVTSEGCTACFVDVAATVVAESVTTPETESQPTRRRRRTRPSQRRRRGLDEIKAYVEQVGFVLDEQDRKTGRYRTRQCACLCGTWVGAPNRFKRGHAARLYHAMRKIKDTDINSKLYRFVVESLEWHRQVGYFLSPQGYGIEAEFTGLGRSTAVETLWEAGISARDDGYHHDRKGYWRVTSDASILYDRGNYDDDSEDYGNELVSPVLLFDDSRSFEAITLASRTLRGAGAFVNSSCGLHVHHCVYDFSPDALASLLVYWGSMSYTLQSVVPYSRRNNGYCRAVGLSHAKSLANDILRIGNDYRSARRAIAGVSRDEINFAAIEEHDTVEFRLHSGTLSAEKIINWVKLTKRIVDLAHDRPIPRDRIHSFEESESLEDTFDRLDLDSELRDFYRKRAYEFSRYKEEDEEHQPLPVESEDYPDEEIDWSDEEMEVEEDV